LDVTRAEAMEIVRDLLVIEFGENLKTETGDQVLLIREGVTEYGTAWLVPFNTRTYLEGGVPSAGALPSAVLVPKDRSIPPHYPPTAWPVEQYLAKVRSGESSWSTPPPDMVIYYARVSQSAPRDPKGLLRRRRVNGLLFDERFVKSLAWEPTDFFRLQRLGHNDDDYVEITALEAETFVEKVRAYVQAHGDERA
jgi:hypothetical protein